MYEWLDNFDYPQDNIRGKSNIEEYNAQVEQLHTDLKKLLISIDDFSIYYPEEYKEIMTNHPNLQKNINRLKILSQGISDNRDEINGLIWAINYSLIKIRNHQQEKNEDYQENELQWTIEQFYTDEEKQQLKDFAIVLWEELFPESNIDRFVKSINNQSELEDYQKILLAPANWIENVIMWIFSLFQGETYTEIFKSLWIMNKMDYEQWCILWRGLSYTYEGLSAIEKTSQIISFIVSIWFLLWSMDKIMTLARKLSLSEKIIKTFNVSWFWANNIQHLKSTWKLAMVSSITWNLLPYIR